MIGVYNNCDIIIQDKEIINDRVLSLTQNGRMIPENTFEMEFEILDMDIDETVKIEYIDYDIFFLYSNNASSLTFTHFLVETLQKLEVWLRDFSQTSIMIVIPRFVYTEFARNILDYFGLTKDKVQLWINGHYKVRKVYTTDYVTVYKTPIPDKIVSCYSRLRENFDAKKSDRYAYLHTKGEPIDGMFRDIEIFELEKETSIKDLTLFTKNIDTLFIDFGEYLLYLSFCEAPKKLIIVMKEESITLDYYVYLLDKVWNQSNRRTEFVEIFL